MTHLHSGIALWHDDSFAMTMTYLHYICTTFCTMTHLHYISPWHICTSFALLTNYNAPSFSVLHGRVTDRFVAHLHNICTTFALHLHYICTTFALALNLLLMHWHRISYLWHHDTCVLHLNLVCVLLTVRTLLYCVFSGVGAARVQLKRSCCST